MKYVVTFTGRVTRDDGVHADTPLTLTVDVDEGPLAGLEGDARLHRAHELAWDEFKRRSGLRRWPGDVAPTIVEFKHEANAEA